MIPIYCYIVWFIERDVLELFLYYLDLYIDTSEKSAPKDHIEVTGTEKNYHTLNISCNLNIPYVLTVPEPNVQVSLIPFFWSF